MHNLFLWAEKKPGFKPSAALFDSMVNILGKAREFEDAWTLILDRIGDGNEGSTLVSVNTFVILIRRYARAGNFLDILHKKASNLIKQFFYLPYVQRTTNKIITIDPLG